MKKKQEIVYFPIVENGKYATICGFPVFTFSNEKGKKIPPKIHPILTLDGKPAKEYPVKADMRLIPLTPRIEKIFSNKALTRVEVNLSGSHYVMVPFVAPEFFISRSNWKKCQMWIADSLICTPSNTMGQDRYLPADLLAILCTELGTDEKLRTAAITAATNETIKVRGYFTADAYQGNSISMLEYTTNMRSILAAVMKKSPKEIASVEYKLGKKMCGRNKRAIRKNKKLAVAK